jgi:hypothetical protein
MRSHRTLKRSQTFVLAVAVGIGMCAVLAGGAWTLGMRSLPSGQTPKAVRTLLASHDTLAALRVMAETTQFDIEDAATDDPLDELYAAICDPVTEEPDPNFAGPHLRLIAKRLLQSTVDRPNVNADAYLRAGKFALAAGFHSESVAMLKRAQSAGAQPDTVLVPLTLALFRSEMFAKMLTTARHRALLWLARGRAFERALSR